MARALLALNVALAAPPTTTTVGRAFGRVDDLGGATPADVVQDARGLMWLASDQGRLLRWCGSFRSVEAFVAALNDPRAMAGRWDVVLMDLGLPGDSGIVGIRELKRRFPGVHVVVVTVFQDTATVVDALQAGADGYCLKGALLPALLDRIRAVCAGGSSFDAVTARSLVEVVRGQVPPSHGDGPTNGALTDRERDVLRCLARGESSKHSADTLGLSVHTVRTHIRSIYRKLQVANVAEAVAVSVRDRLL